METMKITCDSCDCQKPILCFGLAPEEYSRGYWLCLSTMEKPLDGPCDAVLRLPPIDCEKHFCGMVCLRSWILDNE